MPKILLPLLLICCGILSAQPWVQDGSVFNTSGVPSVSFSQPRFCDLDNDGDWDFWLGTTSRAPIYMQNNGSSINPAYQPGPDLAAGISYLGAELAISVDMNADGIPDLVTGGYNGLHLYLNTGTTLEPVWQDQPGYFGALGLGNYPVPDLADVDADGDLDLVVGLSEDGGVRVYTNTGTATAGSFNAANMITIGDVGLYAYPIFADRDHDGDQDILCGRDGQGFIYYQNNGSSTSPDWQPYNDLFSGLGSGTYWNSPDLADLNGNGTLDLLYGTANGPLKIFFNVGTDTTPVWSENHSIFGGVVDVGGASNPVFYDWDVDGDQDMLSGSQLGDIKFYRNTGTAFAPAWQADHSFFSVIDHSIYSSVAAGDLDGDGLPDLVVGDLNGSLYFHRNTGQTLVEQTGVLPNVALGGWSVARLLDWDGDGLLDLFTGSEAGTMRYYRNTGTSTAPTWQEITGFFSGIDVGSNCVPSFGDNTLDGSPDCFVAGNLSGYLAAYRYRMGWTVDTEFVSGISTDQNATPALVDLDHDGDLDLVVGDYDGTFSFYRSQRYSADNLAPPTDLSYAIVRDVMLSWNVPTNPSSPLLHYKVFLDGELQGQTTELFWLLEALPVGSHSVSVTAQYIAGESLPATIEVLIVSNDDLVQMPLSLSNYPNPFNPSTTIRYEVPQNMPFSLDIYNLRGQKLCRLEHGNKSPGSYVSTWDGRDDQGHDLPSGTYILRLRCGERVLTRKLMMIK